MTSKLRDQLVFYGSYHNHPVNQLIHFTFVPVILGSALVWSLLLQDHLSIPSLSLLPHSATPFNAAAAIIVLYTLFYMTLDVGAAVGWLVSVGMPLWLGASWFAVASSHPLRDATILHVVGWWAQIHPGHAIFEKRRPALMDSLVQSLAVAPLFVFFEALFLVGYRPLLRQEVKRGVERELAVGRGGKGKKS